MKRNNETRVMKRSALAVSLAAWVCLGYTGPLLAAQPESATVLNPSHAVNAASSKEAAQKCLNDLRAFQNQMQKDGYWLQEPGAGGYGYPMYGYGYSYGERETLPASGASSNPPGIGYWRARSGYNVRTLIASANILAQRGQEQACEALLTATRDIYKDYVAELRKGGLATADLTHWRHMQLTAARPVAGNNTIFRSDQLVGTDVVNSQGQNLGSVDDIVLSPQTGKIAYLVIGRGGVFGINEKYVPVPWEDFKATTGTNLLVLDTTKGNMDAAPQVKEDQFSPNGNFAQQSKKVDDYWKAHLSK